MNKGNHLLASVGAVIASLVAFASAAPIDAAPTSPVQSIEDTYAKANAALMKGDARTWHALVPLSEDGVLMSPFGGKPSRFADYTPERIERMGRFFRNGDFRQEVVQSFVGQDMVVLATIERTHVEVGGLPAQDWALRVTSVFRKQDGRWVLAHRHADPFVEDVSLSEAARIARGQRDLAAK